MNNYILYIRKSSESEERQVMSLDAQEAEMTRIAQRDNLNVVEIVRESHSAKTSGTRPEFNRMVTGIRKGKYNAILTWAPDRISRNAGDLGVIVDLMDSGKLACIQTYSQLFGNDPNSKFMLLMLGSQAKLENDNKGLGVKRGNREKLRRGDWINSAPFGYLNDKATKNIVTDPERSQYIPHIFEKYATGLYSFKQISDQLYERGLRTKAGRKVFASTVHKIINRTFYYGVMESNGQYYQGNHEPLISKVLFDQCQERLGITTRPRQKNKGFTLSGFITCAVCGCAVTAELKKQKYTYYHCTNGKGICNQRSLNANEASLHTHIAIDMEKLYISPKMIDIIYKAKLEELEQTGDFHNYALDNARNTLQSLSAKKSRLVDTFTNGDIEEPLYKEKLTAVSNEVVNLTQQIEEMEQNATDPYSTIELVYSLFKQGNTMSKRYSDASPEEKREILSGALSNSTLKDRNTLCLQYKSPYDVFARTPVNASFSDLLPDRDSNPD
jgi:DNA invertase Pin-like site-specific DNA recombinase